MRAFIQIGAIVMATMLPAVCTPAAKAGRLGGPMTQVLAIPGYESVYLDVPFVEGETAVVSLVGDGRSIVQLRIYDSDGHITAGTGTWFGPQRAAIDVYRTGTFRVEVRNIGVMPNVVRLATN